MIPSITTPECVSAFIIHLKKGGEAEYLMLHRCSVYLNGTWQMVSGGVHPGEKAWEAALREIKEETNITPDHFYNGDIIESFYVPAIDRIFLVPVFVAVVHHLPMVKLSPSEHDDYEWLPFEEARERLEFHEQKRIITNINQQFVLNSPKPILRIEPSPVGIAIG